MSNPVQSLGNLHSDEMPAVTRSQTQVRQQRGGRATRGRPRGRGRTQPPSLHRAPISGYAGLQYDTQNLSPNSAQTVVEGLTSTFMVDGILPHGDGREKYWAFRLTKPIAVRVYNPAGNRALQDRVECACRAYQRTRIACKHLYWLFGRFHAVLRGNQQVTSMQNSTEIEVVSCLSELYPFIEEQHHSLPDALNQADADADADEDDENDDLAVEAMRA